jgi:hypothetical protein
MICRSQLPFNFWNARIVHMKVMALVAWTVASVFLPGANGARVSPVEAARPAQAARTCQNVQLLIRAQNSQGAAGTIAVIYRIHNLTGQPCTLFGYPGVQLLDRHFLSLPTRVHRGGYPVSAIQPRLVHITPHGNAYFTLVYSDVPVNNQPCEATASYLMIWAPNDVLPVVTYASGGGGGITACTGNITVSPVTAQPRYQ